MSLVQSLGGKALRPSVPKSEIRQPFQILETNFGFWDTSIK